MKRTLSEQKVLNRLGITDFRHLSKEKIVQFVSMLQYMDPDVAKKALEQFPKFSEYVGQIIAEYKGFVAQALTSNSNSQCTFYNACEGILLAVEQELQKDALSKEEREYIQDEILKITQMISDKDSENKGFILKIVTVVGVTLTGAIATATAILGVSHQTSHPFEKGCN